MSRYVLGLITVFISIIVIVVVVVIIIPALKIVPTTLRPSVMDLQLILLLK